eukprot:1229210-Rhodomonas_salina.2
MTWSTFSACAPQYLLAPHMGQGRGFKLRCRILDFRFRAERELSLVRSLRSAARFAENTSILERLEDLGVSKRASEREREKQRRVSDFQNRCVFSTLPSLSTGTHPISLLWLTSSSGALMSVLSHFWSALGLRSNALADAQVTQENSPPVGGRKPGPDLYQTLRQT